MGVVVLDGDTTLFSHGEPILAEVREVKRARTKGGRCYEVYFSKDETTLPFTLQHLSYDMMVMDRHMPLMDGLEATRQICKMDGPISRSQS